MNKKCQKTIALLEVNEYNTFVCYKKRGGSSMAKTVVRENESLDDALRRFKRQVSRTGTLAEARKREFYVKPGLKRKMKSEAARKNQKRRRR